MENDMERAHFVRFDFLPILKYFAQFIIFRLMQRAFMVIMSKSLHHCKSLHFRTVNINLASPPCMQ